MFNKSKFAELLKKAIGERTTTNYADITGVNRTYISKLLNEKLDSPPGPEIIKKLASVTHGGVTYEDFMTAAGFIEKEEIEKFNNATSLLRDARTVLNQYVDNIEKGTANKELAASTIKTIKKATNAIDELTKFLQKEQTRDEYVLSALNLPDALIRVAELSSSIDDDEFTRLSRLVIAKFGAPKAVRSSDPAAHTTHNIPGTGIFDPDEFDNNDNGTGGKNGRGNR